MNNKNSLQSQELPGGLGGIAPEPTSIDLCRPADLNLVYQAVLNGWLVPQYIRDQICAQLPSAMAHYADRTHDRRSTARLVKLGRLALLMEVSNDVGAGLLRSMHPWGRKRYPEKRKPRRSFTRDHARAVEQMLEKLAMTNPALADRIRARVTKE